MKRKISIVDHPSESFPNKLAIKIESAGDIAWVYGGTGHIISESDASCNAMQKSFRNHSEANLFITERLGS